MEVIKKLFYRRFSKDEYKQLRTILSEETKVMLKRPQYIIGHILIIGLLFYFLMRAFGLESFTEWLNTAKVVRIVVGTAVGTCVFYLLGKIVSKGKSNNLKIPVVFFGFVMLVTLLTSSLPHSRVNWEFAIYTVLTLLGWLFCTASIKENFCEKIFMSQKQSKQ